MVRQMLVPSRQGQERANNFENTFERKIEMKYESTNFGKKRMNKRDET